MKLTLKHYITAAVLAALLALAAFLVMPAFGAAAANLPDTGNITCAVAEGNYLNDDYVSVYRVPTSMMSFEANGGAANGRPLENAFDGRWNTFWQTGKENSAQNDDNPTFANEITVKFDRAFTIDSIVYASSNEREGHGYPITLNIYTAGSDGKLSLYGTINSAATNSRMVFTFAEAITVNEVKFEFRRVNQSHNWTATAKEICFMQPDNENINKALDLFDDYAQLNVKDAYKDDIGEIRKGVVDFVGYESALKPLIDRAEAVVRGYLRHDPRREFSTNEDAQNVINRYGNLRNYAGGTLKMSSFGINRQVLGVGGLTGQTITIYVEAGENDPLPQVAFNQIYGDWRSWQSPQNLQRGKNIFTFPNFITDNYSRATTPGGAIHIINPYEKSQQSENVKVYVEGGFLYPVFRKGGDVGTFLMELKSYYERLQNTEGMVDITELVGDHFIHTVSATTSYRHYVEGTVDPQKSAAGWDDYIKALIEFGGVSFDPDNEHYNKKNEHLYTNFRMVQPWAGAAAFAAGDHIGFITFSEASLVSYGTLGWGVAHEIGHSLDVNGRTIGETTNNMWSKFALAYFENNVSRNFNAVTTNTLTPDETAVDSGFFNTNTYNYQIWWNLEAVHHGFWGELDNAYRYFDERAALEAAGVTAADGTLTQTERMVFYSSLVMGEDLGYYYERFGFSFSTGDNYAPFKRSTATSAYNKLVSRACETGAIKAVGQNDVGTRFWYIDAEQYYRDEDDGCYDGSSTPEIVSASKSDNGYTLYIERPADAGAHLGYEIMEKRDGEWKVIGFTYSSSFTDTTNYPNGYVPEYKIRGVDRTLETSAESAPVKFDAIAQTRVCRIGATYYDSLSAAVAAASANDIIYLCKALMYEGAVTVDKNLTIQVDFDIAFSSDVTIVKTAAGPLITVKGGATLNIGSSGVGTVKATASPKIILDGNGFSQNGTLIKNEGKLIAYNLELVNNINTDHGGAVYNTGDATFNGVTIRDNYTGINGGAIANFSGGVIALIDCIIEGNTAKGNGGALTLDGKTTLNRTTITGNSAGNIGGAMYIACNNDAREIIIDGGLISNNTAKNGGSAFYLEKGKCTIVGGESAAHIGGEIYKKGGTLFMSNAEVDFSDATFGTPVEPDGFTLFAAAGGLTFTDDYAKGLKFTVSSTAGLNDNASAIIVKPVTATVTITLGDSSQKHEIALGEFTLPSKVEGVAEDKYIAAWKSGGKTYALGEKVSVDGDCEFTAELANKYAVSVSYGKDIKETFYVVPGDRFYLPVDSPIENAEIFGWTVGDNWYMPAAGIAVNGNMEVVADTIKLFKVTINANGEITESWHEFADSIVLGDCKAPSGKKFSHWKVGNEKYKAGETVSVTDDMTITAVFVDIDDGLSGGIIALIVILVLLAVAGIVVAVIIVLKKKKKGGDKGDDKSDKKKAADKKKAEKKAERERIAKTSEKKEEKSKEVKKDETAKDAATKPAATAKPAPTSTTARPVTTGTTARPVTTSTTARPTPTARPTTTSATARPATTGTTARPATTTSTARPAPTSTAVRPTPTARPTTTGTTTRPTPTARPTATGTTTRPAPTARPTTTSTARPAPTARPTTAPTRPTTSTPKNTTKK